MSHEEQASGGGASGSTPLLPPPHPLGVDPPAADLWRVLPCTNAEGARRWVYLLDRELHVLDPTSGRWFDPISISYPVRGRDEDMMHDVCAVPGGGVALGLVNGWAMVDLD